MLMLEGRFSELSFVLLPSSSCPRYDVNWNVKLRFFRKFAESGFVPIRAGHLCSSPLEMGASPSRYLTIIGVQLWHLLLEKGLEFLQPPQRRLNNLKYLCISLIFKQDGPMQFPAGISINLLSVCLVVSVVNYNMTSG